VEKAQAAAETAQAAVTTAEAEVAAAVKAKADAESAAATGNLIDEVEKADPDANVAWEQQPSAAKMIKGFMNQYDTLKRSTKDKDTENKVGMTWADFVNSLSRFKNIEEDIENLVDILFGLQSAKRKADWDKISWTD
jgi:hypothetical protein